MATDEENISWKLDLDSEGFKKGIDQAKEGLGLLAEEAGLPTAALKTMVGTTAVVVAAVAAMKAAITMVETAEDVAAVNTQFDLLAKNAGIAGDEIKERLIKSAGGLAEDTEIIRAANKAIISMGQSAERLPEIMDLARKSSALTGESLMSTFENLSRAMETGNKRALKQYGIFVDTTAAVKKYADAHGVAVATLSEAGRRQALLNAAIDAGNKSLKDVNPNLRDTSNTLESLKSTLKNIGEVVSIAFDKLAGPSVRKFLRGVQEMASDAKQSLVASFGTGKEQVEAKLEETHAAIMKVKDKLLRSEGVGGKLGFFEAMGFDKAREQAYLRGLEMQFDELKKKKEEFAASQRSPAGETTKTPEATEDPEKKKAAEIKFNQEISKLKSEALKESLNNITTLDEAEKIADAEELERKKQLEEQKAAIDKSAEFNDTQKAAIKAQMDHLAAERELSLQDEVTNFKIKAMENELSVAESVNGQIAAQARLTAIKTEQSWRQAGMIGGAAMTSFQNHTMSAFKGIGDGSKTVSDAMKEMFLGTIGEVAAKQGEAMFLASFETWPIWPTPKTAGGLALIALGGALGAAGGGSPSLTSAGSGGGLSSSGNELPPTVTTPASDQQKQAHKTFTLEVHGNVWGSEQTSKEIVDMFRKAADATDYKYVQIGN